MLLEWDDEWEFEDGGGGAELNEDCEDDAPDVGVPDDWFVEEGADGLGLGGPDPCPSSAINDKY